MDYFSEEYRDKLIKEHKLISAAILRLTDRYKQYVTNHGVDAMTAALTSLRGEKVQLETKIDILDEFLHGN